MVEMFLRNRWLGAGGGGAQPGSCLPECLEPVVCTGGGWGHRGHTLRAPGEVVAEKEQEHAFAFLTLSFLICTMKKVELVWWSSKYQMGKWYFPHMEEKKMEPLRGLAGVPASPGLLGGPGIWLENH